MADEKRPRALAIMLSSRAMKPEEEEEDYSREGMRVAARDVREAIESKDDDALADALHAYFELCEEMPHEEGPHLEEEED